MINPPLEKLPEAIAQLYDKLVRVEELLTEHQLTELENSRDLLTTKGAARFLDVSVPTIYNRVRNAELPVIRRGGKNLFSKQDLKKWAQASTNKKGGCHA